MAREYKRRRGLSATQRLGVLLAVQGLGASEIAKRLNVHRVTVTNWMNHDELFIAELNGVMKELTTIELRRLAHIRR